MTDIPNTYYVVQARLLEAEFNTQRADVHWKASFEPLGAVWDHPDEEYIRVKFPVKPGNDQIKPGILIPIEELSKNTIQQIVKDFIQRVSGFIDDTEGQRS